MEKKKTRKMLAKRFCPEDISKWQVEANIEYGGNLNLWMEQTLNAVAFKNSVKRKLKSKTN